MYRVPSSYYYRIHHVRPRFKNQVENVLVYLATNISDLGKLEKMEFNQRLNKIIENYPGNKDKSIKTINNWRTEISSLFGLIVEDDDGLLKPGERSKELTENQDLVQFFKTFLFNFEYPGAHLKNQEIVKQCIEGIKFQPGKYILNVFLAAERYEGKDIYLTSSEVTHCIFNDLRCTRDNEDPLEVWKRIKKNRIDGVKYDESGDTVRYAGDILDYMDIANLLKERGRKFYLNHLENETINIFINSGHSFLGYSEYIGVKNTTIDDIRDARTLWFKYVNRELTTIDFRTDLASLSVIEEDYTLTSQTIFRDLDEHINDTEKISTAIVGGSGESLIISFEKQKLRDAGKIELQHLVNFIPTPLAVGYDIQSIESNGSDLRKYIEVKTTISNRALTFNSFRITPNEWRTAKSVKERYYIYRLKLSQNSKKLFILENLYEKVIRNEVSLIERSDGFDVRFYDSVGYEEVIS